MVDRREHNRGGVRRHRPQPALQRTEHAALRIRIYGEDGGARILQPGANL